MCLQHAIILGPFASKTPGQPGHHLRGRRADAAQSTLLVDRAGLEPSLPPATQICDARPQVIATARQSNQVQLARRPEDLPPWRSRRHAEEPRAPCRM
eukprot:scaffold31162_cov107-Isochrysis_galbana.AAC.2